MQIFTKTAIFTQLHIASSLFKVIYFIGIPMIYTYIYNIPTKWNPSSSLKKLRREN